MMPDVGDQVRYRDGVNAAFGTTDRPERRGLVSRVHQVSRADQVYFVVEWPDGLSRTAQTAELFEVVPA